MEREQRSALRSAVAKARGLLEKECQDQLEGSYNILPDGRILDNAPGDPIVRARLIDVIAHHQASGVSAQEAIARTVHEAAFTILNRFAALKMAERRGIVRECISQGLQSLGIRELADCAPGLSAALDDGGYRLLLEALMDEISIDLKELFDRRSPTAQIWPRPKSLGELLEVLNARDLIDLWRQDETIGWIYQYFNPKEERDAMRKASRSPRNTRELAVRNQFFTPRYVVEFLTDNTLGRIWHEMRKGDTALGDKCRYLVRWPNEVFLAPEEQATADQVNEPALSQEEQLKKSVYIEHRPKRDPRDIRILDPACGSGHFLLYAFDLLERIYEEAFEDPQSPKSDATGCTLWVDFGNLSELRQAVPKLIIERNLHGIDIDPRAVQIAALALWLRAQKAWKNLGIEAKVRPQITKSNIVTAEPMPGEDDMRREFIADLKPRVLGQLVDVVFEKMKLAGEAGSLLKIEEEIKEAVAVARTQWLEDTKLEHQLLFPGMANPRPRQQELRFDLDGATDEGFWEQAEDRIVDALKSYAERAENGRTVCHRLFAEDATRGFAFIDLCRSTYDIVLMNPPFGASSRASKKYIEDRYQRTKGDVLANFIERSLLLTSKQGRVGAISSRTPFFLGSFEALRTEVLGKTGHLRLLADLGDGVLEAMVETAIYVLNRVRSSDQVSTFFRLLIETEKAGALQKITADHSTGTLSRNTFLIKPRTFKALRGSPYAYWVSKSTIETLAARPAVEGNMCSIRVGLQTSKDFRFLRLLWEVPTESLVLGAPAEGGRSIAECSLRALSGGQRWTPFSKTDVAVPWYSPITLAVNWANSGAEIKAFAIGKGDSPSRSVRSEGEYFRPGFSYMLRSTRLVPYLVPRGVVPTAGRAQVFPKDGEEYAVLAICASNVGSAVARFSGEQFARPKFQASMVQELPACDFPEETLVQIKAYVDDKVDKRRAVAQRFEPFQEFTLPAWFCSNGVGETTWDPYSLFGRELESKIAEALGLSFEQLAELERDVREAVSIRGTFESTETEEADDEASYSEQELNVEVIPETPEEKAVGLIMYTVGVVVGRWDVRIAQDPSLAPRLPDPLDPLPVCPPGMLVSPDGLPAVSGRIVSEDWLRARQEASALPSEGSADSPTIPDDSYPLRISWDGIFVDNSCLEANQSNRDNIVPRVREVFSLFWKEKAYEIEQEVCKIIDARGLHDYFRRPNGFFADHLKRYTKNHRKAPIYLPLSTASGSYTVWLYYPRLTADTLYRAVSEHVETTLRQVREHRLKAEAEQRHVEGRKAADLSKRIEELFDTEQELEELRTEMLRVAALPYKPDLNDGVQLTAAPLYKLFRYKPWQKVLQDTWRKLEKGEYEWAHLAYAIWPDRVREKCKGDRAIAIAHGLEDLFEGDTQAGSNRRSKRSV